MMGRSFLKGLGHSTTRSDGSLSAYFSFNVRTSGSRSSTVLSSALRTNVVLGQKLKRERIEDLITGVLIDT